MQFYFHGLYSRAIPHLVTVAILVNFLLIWNDMYHLWGAPWSSSHHQGLQYIIRGLIKNEKNHMWNRAKNNFKQHNVFGHMGALLHHILWPRQIVLAYMLANVCLFPQADTYQHYHQSGVLYLTPQWMEVQYSLFFFLCFCLHQLLRTIRVLCSEM